VKRAKKKKPHAVVTQSRGSYFFFYLNVSTYSAMVFRFVMLR